MADVDAEVRRLLAYPLAETVAAGDAKSILEDDFKQIVDAVLAAEASGELATALAGGHEGYKVRAWMSRHMRACLPAVRVQVTQY